MGSLEAGGDNASLTVGGDEGSSHVRAVLSVLSK
jgi:hypothetical protein